MATIEERTRGEEILIRLNENGVTGAHYKTITEYVRDGEVLPGAVINAPISLALVGGSGGPSLQDMLGEVAATVLLQFEAAVNEVANLSTKLTASEARVAELTTQAETLAAQALEDAAQIAGLGTALHTALEQVRTLQDALLTPAAEEVQQDPE